MNTAIQDISATPMIKTIVFDVLPGSVIIVIVICSALIARKDFTVTPRMSSIVFNAKSRIARIVILPMFARFARKDFNATQRKEEKLVFNDLLQSL